MAKILTSRSLLRALAVCCLLAPLGVGLWLVGIYGLTEYHLRQARQALERQRYGHALMELQTALSFRPRSAELHLLAGRTARQAGNFSTAWDHLHRCRELQKGVTSDLQMEEYLLRAQTGEMDEVFPFLLPHLTQDDAQTPLVLETLSHAYLFLYRFDNAWQCLERWLALQPDNVEALFLRGNYYSLTGKLDEAGTDLRRVLELDPKRIHARLLLAQTLKESHHPEEAAVEYEIAFQQEPTNLKARLGLASCYVDSREWSKAESILEGRSAENEDDPEILHLLGRIAEGEGRYAQAIPYLQAAVAARPSDNIGCYHLILCYQQMGDDDSAGKYQDLLDRIEKDELRLIAITTREKEALPTNPALCCELGELCLRLGIERRGLHWLQAALRLDPHFRRAHERLLRYYEQLGPEGEEEARLHRRMLGQAAVAEPRPLGSGGETTP